MIKTKIPVLGKLLSDRNTLLSERDVLLAEKNIRMLENERLLNENEQLKAQCNSIFAEKEKIVNEYHYLQIVNNYDKVLLRIFKNVNNNPKHKVKVAFLVSENQKWNCHSLFAELKNNPRFEPVVLVTLLSMAHQGIDKSRNNLEENYRFFKDQGMKVEKAYDARKKAYITLEKFKPDIVFFQQPWGLDESQNIESVSQFALTAYIPYSFRLFDYENNYIPQFHGHLWKYFVESEFHLSMLKKHASTDNMFVSGYPKLDVYCNNFIGNGDNQWSYKHDKKIKRIIYAPHHSITPTPLALSTFSWSGEQILEFAKKTPNLEWIFKPHPNLLFNYINTFPKQKMKIEKYYQKWASLPNAKIYDQGDYFDIFRTADIMITDSGSFLAEFLPTRKPVIHLRNKQKYAPFNILGKQIIKTYYQVFSIKELNTIFTEVVINGKDDLKKSRLELINKLNFSNKKTADNIIYHLEKTIFI